MIVVQLYMYGKRNGLYKLNITIYKKLYIEKIIKMEKIRFKSDDIISIVKECTERVLEEIANIPYFSSYDEFEVFLEKTEGTMEYYYISKEKSGLNVDIYIDDCSSYIRYNHPLWLYFCDGYSHNDNLIPISVSENPSILIDNCEINISSIDYESIRCFIRQNLQLLRSIANEDIDSVKFSKQLTKPSFSFSVVESNNMINEMAKIESEYSNLGFDIYIDASPRITQHNEYRIKYPINKDAEQGNNSHNYVPMSVCDNPEFLPPKDVDKFNEIADMKRKRIMQNFIKIHKKELQDVSDGIIDLNTYKLQLKVQTNQIRRHRNKKD